MEVGITVLGSGSNGNCYIIREKDHYIILDCGLKFIDITHNPNFPKFNQIDFVFCSHCHGDHSQSLKDFKLTGIPIISYETLEPKVQHCEIGDWQITTFPLKHNVENWGIIIKSKITNQKLCYVTDFVSIPKIEGIDFWIYEVNYEEYIIERIAENDFDALKFGFQNHNSLERAVEYFTNIKYKPKVIIACHLSANHANPEYIIEKLKSFADKIYIAKKNLVIDLEAE